jgi:hypothetical protein
MFGNKVLRKMFGPKEGEGSEEFSILHNKVRRDLYKSLSFVRIVECRRVRWAWHVAKMRKQGLHTERW